MPVLFKHGLGGSHEFCANNEEIRDLVPFLNATLTSKLYDTLSLFYLNFSYCFSRVPIIRNSWDKTRSE